MFGLGTSLVCLMKSGPSNNFSPSHSRNERCGGSIWWCLCSSTCWECHLLILNHPAWASGRLCVCCKRVWCNFDFCYICCVSVCVIELSLLSSIVFFSNLFPIFFLPIYRKLTVVSCWNTRGSKTATTFKLCLHIMIKFLCYVLKTLLP